MRFEQANSTLVLAAGRVDVDVDASRGQRFRVTTQHFRVEVLGTRFAVTPRSVVVTRGHVQVFALDGRVLASDLAAGGAYSYREPAVPAPAVSAEAWLGRAREALSRGELQAALQLVERAEGSAPRRGDRAEAATLRAEAALLSKQLEKAIDLYAGVSEQYADLAAGENAAFAAAQLAARAKPDRERGLLERYLTRHPGGRFADEAKRRLAKLTAH